MNGSRLLVLDNLCVWYTAGKPVLDRFSMELGTNEIVGLIGLNGAGKTTFIKTLSGLIDSFQMKAALWQNKAFSFRDIGFKKDRYVVFAEDHSFQFFTFREYASYVAASYGKTLSDVNELVQGFHFEEYTDILLKELSTGNLKKAYLITAFALKPKLLILDEPMNGLDFQSTEYLYRQMNGYRQIGTILFSSHILESICLTSDRVLILEQGRMKQSFAGQEMEAEIAPSVLFLTAVAFSLILSANLLLSFLKLWKTNAYVFYHPIQAKHFIRHTKRAGNIFLYLLRYVLTNKNYLWNTACLCVIACFLPFLWGQFKELNTLPLGFAILCLNTPICILLSCDLDLEQAVRVLPEQAERFCIHYCVFIFSVNMTVNSVYLINLQIQYGGIGGMEILTALLLALQSAILSVLLEWFCPIRDRKIEADVWHHPRKYIVPCIMMLIAGFIGMWSAGIWILLGVVMAECFSLLFLTIES